MTTAEARESSMRQVARHDTPAVEALLGRLQALPGEVAAAIFGKTDAEQSERPATQAWSPKEIVCHLRDVEELFQIRFHTVVALYEQRILVLGATAADLAPWRIGGSIGHPLDPDRWAVERQYRKNDKGEALYLGGPAARAPR